MTAKQGSMRADGALLYVRDVAKSAAFYRLQFGFAATNVTSAEFTIVELEGWRLYLHRDPAPFTGNLAGLEARKTRGDGVIVHFRVGDVDAWAARFESAGHTISRKPATTPYGLRECYVYDPDGYNLVVVTLMRR